MQAMAMEDLATGGRLLAELIRGLPLEAWPHPLSAILEDCARRLDAVGLDTAESLPLAVHCVRFAFSRESLHAGRG
jgi:hypothetical protein